MSPKNEPQFPDHPNSGVSACLIVRDEELFLPECLAAVRPWVEEICVLDTGSSDRSIAIAQSFGATIGHFTWCDDFAAARNASLALCTYPFILVLDADELLDQTTGAALRNAIASDKGLAYLVNVDSLRQDGSAWGVLLPRLFRNHPGIRYLRPVHEDISDSLFALGQRTIPDSGVRLIHKGYLPDVVAARDKLGRNLAILRERVKQAPDDLYSTYKLAASLSQPYQVDERIGTLVSAVTLAERLPPEQRAEHPFLPLCYAGLAADLTDKGALTQASQIVDQGLLVFPQNVDLMYRKGDLLRRIGEPEAAAQFFKPCIGAERASLFYSSDPGVRGVLPAIGLCLCALEAGSGDAAVSLAALALRLDPTSIEARCLQTRVMFMCGRYVESNEMLQELWRVAPMSRYTQYLAGELAWQQRDRPMAMDLWRSVLGSQEMGNEALAMVAHGELCDGARSSAVLRLQDLIANDCASAAVRVLLSAVAGVEMQLDPAFRAPMVLKHLCYFLKELLFVADQPVLVDEFRRNAPNYEARLPGISVLVTKD